MYPKPPPFSEFGFSILICCSKVTLSVNATSHRLTHLFKMAESSSMSPKPGSKMLGSDHSSTASPLPYTEVVVVRHGETEWNADGRLQGHLDVLLNDTGRQQAAAVANRLSKEPKIAAIYSSDLKRALTTAEIIAASCGGLEVVEDGDLRERHLGQLQGLVLRDTAKVNPEAYQAFLSRRTSQDIPGGGESLDQLYLRSTSSLQRIARKHRGERVVVVTHGGVIRALYRRACPNKKPAGKILNTSVNVFQIIDGGKWVVKVWGDVSHLNQTEYLDSGFGGDGTSG
ncbi:phosphoglycerate mutase-like protein 4 isoform X2 [Mercurialis annua]|uniref:phosphoglycerate mutase-like protein 4 isoform X2 n=1 Tax=Mercurialis annua TaxID=3986 RepID=UPI00215EBF31|nr:phosphoglycerate mutase-like protein 4 isoform X2 [Mercurialis annua]